MNKSIKETEFKPFTGDLIHFSCYKDIPCFNRCCAKLRLILMPYDILRIKKRLRLTSDDFLETYTDTVIENQFRFPMVRLKMNDDQEEACPFVTEEGCRIYKDRPSACRLYPLGRASTMLEDELNAREKFFVVRESHCLGLNEKKAWTLDDWLSHEGINKYNAMNDQWFKIITSSKHLDTKNLTQKFKMFFMASYNLDHFRKFILKSKFLDLFEVTPDTEKELRQNDEALMQFGFNWLRFSLFGEKTIKLRG